MPELNHADQLLSIVLMLIMFSIGATLRFSDFRKTFWLPAGVITGLILQMIFLPLLAFCVLLFVDIDPLFKVGFMIVALCPGGATANFVSYLINADVALSISLTTINSILILFTIPLGTNLALIYFVGSETEIVLPFGDTMWQVIFVILLPAFLGVLFNAWMSKVSRALRNPLKVINTVLLALVFGIKYFGSEEAGGVELTKGEISSLLPVGLAIQVLTMVISYFIATRFIKRKTSCATVGIEVGLQNTTLALFISSVVLGLVDVSKPAVVFSMFSFITTLIFAGLVYRFVIWRNRQKFLGD